MKILKLLAIFIVIVGGILLALNWGSLFSSSSDADGFISEDKIDIKKKCAEIRDAWAAQSGWNEALYRSQREDIDQSMAMKLFSREGYNVVNNTLHETVTNKVRDSYMAALHADPFNEIALKEQYDGVKYVKQAEKLGSDARITKVEQIHQLYTSINAFAKSKHVISPNFNKQTADWVSFASAQSGVLATARKYRQNPLFAEMENIPGFKAALNEEALKKITSPQRSAFYSGLSQQIVSHFQDVEPTQDNYNLFNQIYKNYVREESSIGVSDMATQLVSMKGKLNQ